jgi:Flp pilus assembly protein TadG
MSRLKIFPRKKKEDVENLNARNRGKTLNNGGSMYVDHAIFIIVVLLVVAISLNTAKVFLVKQSVDDVSTELIRTAEIYGRIGEETTARRNALAADIGFSPTVTWTPGNGNVQLGDEISVIVTTNTKVGLGGFLELPIELKARATGHSEVYWKE